MSRSHAAGSDRKSAHDPFIPREAILSWMHEIAPYGIFTTDQDLRVRSWNDWLARHSGLTADEVLGRPLLDLFPTLRARRLDETFRRALTGEISVLSTALHKHLLPFPSTARDADVPHMLQTVRIAPLPGEDGVVGTITIIEDVTQREWQALQLQRQQEQDHLLSSTLAVLLKSADPLEDIAALLPTITQPLGFDVYLNYLYDLRTETLRLHASSGILPKQREGLAILRLGESLCGHCAAERKPTVVSHLQSLQDDVAEPMRRLGLHSYCCFPLVIENRLVGTLALASYTRDAIATDEVVCLSTVAHYFAIAIDRAQRTQVLRDAQSALSEHAENLEVKVAERTARLHDTIAQLESFSYTVAHDLRAPIRSLKGYCEILRSDYALPPDARVILDRLLRASHRLDALTRDLLKFSRVSRQDISLERVDLAEVLHELRVLTPALEGQVLEVRTPLHAVIAERSLVQQCLSNLLDNALKFARPGVPLHIIVRTERCAFPPVLGPTLRPEAFNPALRFTDTTPPILSEGQDSELKPRPGPWIRIWIEDNGMGIPPEAHGKIFGIFERGSGHDHIEGTGIGLAIVARAVQQMDGECGVESEPGRGSRFWLAFAPADLPVAETPVAVAT